MPKLRIDLSLTAETGISVGAGGSSGTIADRNILRDGSNRPIIPGSHVKGKARHAAEALLATLKLPRQHGFDDDESHNDNAIRRIFGSPQAPSPLRFVDLISTVGSGGRGSDDLTYLRPSVAINRRRGVAEDERLLLIEATRERLEFAAAPAISGQLDQLQDLALLWAALRLTQRWGGAKARGLGWATMKIAVFWGEGTTQLSDEELAAALRQIKGGVSS